MAESSDGTVTFSCPTVVQRVYKIQYEPQSEAPCQHSLRNTQKHHRMSMKTYDTDTDSDIFKLGNAFKSGNFDVDELLKTWSNSGGYKVEKVETSTNGDTITQVRSVAPSVDTITQVRSVAPSVDTISQVRSVAPSVDTSLLPTVASDGSGYPAVVRRQKIITTICRSSKESSPVGSQTEPVMNSFSEPICPFTLEIPQPDYKQEEVRGERADWQTERVEPSGEEEDILDRQQPHTGSTCVDVEDSTSEEDIHTQWRRSLCPGRKPYTRRRRINKAMVEAHKGARSGMTASEVSVPGQEMKLPAIQKLILNYSQMLDRFPELFVETFFRAVKLNGLDVIKILCQLVMRKNIPLGSAEMREPESSATVLHVALLYDHEDIVEHLISLGDRDLLMATYTKQEYRNQTALHVAVANGNIRVVHMLLKALNKRDKKVLLNTIATGTYFQHKHPEGQLCVSAAAWSGNSDILVLLARHGASFAISNLEGNTLLHRIILASAENPEQTNYQQLIDKVFVAVGEWAKHRRYKTTIADQRQLEQSQKQINTFHKLLNIQNNHGETPLILAAQRGSPLLLYLINMEKIFKIPQTKLGSIAWVTYDVTDITTYADGAYNKFSVLHVLAHNSGKLSRHANLDPEQDSSFLDAEPIKSLLDMKWSVYRWLYISWCLVHLVHIILFTYCTFDNNSVPYSSHPDSQNASEVNQPPLTGAGQPLADSIHYGLGLFTILPTLYIILEFIDWFGNYPYSILFMRNQSFFSKVANRIQSEWVITGNGPYRLVALGYSVSTNIWYSLYLKQHGDQDVALSTALLLGWIFVLFFTRGCRVTSRFSIMIQKMFFRDLMYFLAVYIMILAAFSFSINAMYSNLHVPTTSLPNVMYRMMNIVTQLDDQMELKMPSHPLFTKVLMVFYAIVAVILLMNMLIAMMNTSYETVRITRCNIWKQQQLSIMLMIERRLVWARCLCSRSEGDVWHKEWEECTRAYLDVTTTQHRECTPEISRDKIG